MTSPLDTVETMLASLICGNDPQSGLGQFSKDFGQRRGGPITADAGNILKFGEQSPRRPYIAQVGADREFATDANLLLHSTQDLLGRHAEIALFDEVNACVKWAGFKKLNNTPRGVWVASTGADLYEYHYRTIFMDGRNTYAKRVAAISKSGRPVQVVIEGTRDTGVQPDGVFLVMAASIIEDARCRPGTFLAEISSDVGVAMPVAQGAHLELFALRDGPYSGDRRKPLLHWVAKHTRHTTKGDRDVKSHMRGVHEFEIDGLRVRLTAPKEAP